MWNQYISESHRDKLGICCWHNSLREVPRIINTELSFQVWLKVGVGHVWIGYCLAFEGREQGLTFDYRVYLLHRRALLQEVRMQTYANMVTYLLTPNPGLKHSPVPYSISIGIIGLQCSSTPSSLRPSSQEIEIPSYLLSSFAFAQCPTFVYRGLYTTLSIGLRPTV